ncbi:MAG: gliding motility lipoprotein GldD [Hyphomicrobiales bacterium]
MRKFIISGLISTLAMLFAVTACDNNYTPKPRGYFRINLPEHEYAKFDTNYPFSFEYSKYSVIEPDNEGDAERYWINIVYPNLRSKIHISYKKVDNNLYNYLEDAYQMVNKHMQKASGISDSLFVDKDREVYGITYRIDGIGAASPYQFVLTDSTSNFLRGALYFYVRPNNDSLAPVIDYIEKDIEHMINTLQWKEVKNK